MTIPASQIVAVTPSVISGGGVGLDVIGVMLTDDARMPTGTLLAFPDADTVADYFGPTSQMAALATNYFLGFTNSTVKPGRMLAYAYPMVSVGAWLRGISPPGGTALADIETISGTLSIDIDGSTESATIDLSGVASYSEAAQIIQSEFGIVGPSGASFTGVIAGTTLTASSVTGTLATGQLIDSASIAADTYIVAQLSGTTGGAGTYTVSVSQTVSSEAMTTTTAAVEWDSLSSAFLIRSSTTGASSTITYATGTAAAPLGWASTQAGTLSQGQVAGVPATTMAAIKALSANWASFMTTMDPDGGSGNDAKYAFAVWCNGQNNGFLYACWDTDADATQVSAPDCLGERLKAANISGTALMYAPTLQATEAAFLMGAIASIDFNQTNGRVTMAFRNQTGLVPDVTDAVTPPILESHGYNYYGVWATRSDTFQFLYTGGLSGPFAWIDSYINQIWLNAAFQQALMSFLTQVFSIPYNRPGYDRISAAARDPIDRALNFGAIQTGITLSAAQKALLRAQAGVDISPVLFAQGWYFQVKDPGAQVRGNRGSPVVNFWYTDGQSVQRIQLGSTEIM